MITRLKNAVHGAVLGWKKSPPVCKRDWRPSWLPIDISFGLESVAHPHSPEERAELFLAHNAGSTEIETLNWLHATVCLTKPASILETGALDGLGTIALATACRDNGFGKVHSVEIEAAACERLSAKMRRYRLEDFVEVHCADSKAFLRDTNLTFDFGFFDSLCEIRAEEYRICRERAILKGIAAFHDTSPHRTKKMLQDPPAPAHELYRREIHDLARDEEMSGCFENTLARGLFVIFPKVEISSR
ncbi:class I SAM-dependent methyltransferase [Horticoccus luteus]|uniref:Class I SAM-dependent methyltransferase n=1 Tax=Horticoccus luteus TaxID=2862869 RepID=A0A8F9XIK5_9BACT|nr:class I SAM-dependent methyltransferase [Horticoccus luteus]QYM80500.1 class I SAM-dependent methyltransferase [Horticoccus luteus]